MSRRESKTDEKIKALENQITILEHKYRDLQIKYDFSSQRSLMYQKLLAEYVLESCYQDTSLQPPAEYILRHGKRLVVNRNDEAITDRESLFKDWFRIAFGITSFPFPYKSQTFDFDIFCLFSTKGLYESFRLITEAQKIHRPLLFADTGFLLSILPMNNHNADTIYRQHHSLVLDSHCPYTDAWHISELETMLQSDKILTDDELMRARNAMREMVHLKLSKYNHQPIRKVKIGTRPKKVLVVDQVYGDASIRLGMASDHIFPTILLAACEENPGADIIIKTHPASDKLKQQHFQDIPPNVYVVDYELNPYCLLDIVEKVYVCTSQMGFEALMCGKEVHVFGMPFYAGWGLTKDRQILPRRTRRRTLEEVFFIVYFMYNRYVSYKTMQPCCLEQAMAEIQELRETYWADLKKRG